VSFQVTDGENEARLTAFGDTYTWRNLQVIEPIYVEATVETWNGSLQLKNPVLIPHHLAGKLLPRYRGKRGVVSEQAMYDKTRYALDHYLEATAEYILSYFDLLSGAEVLKRAQISFKSLSAMLKAIHAPESLQEGQEGLKAAKQLAAFEVIYRGQKLRIKRPNPTSVISLKQKDIDSLKAALPFSLTEHQDKAIDEICNDLVRPYPMRRLLSGDVGTGKTLAFLIPALAAHAAGAKVAILTPNALLAQQAAREVAEFFGQVKPKPKFCIITSTTSKDAVDWDANPIMIGTTALLNKLRKKKWVPDLLIVDEQHKASRDQREALMGPHTNMLEATATCIPRTAALVFHGGMDVSILNQCPVQKKIYSRVVQRETREQLFDYLDQIVAKGGQTAVVYPLKESEDARRGVAAAAEVWERKYPGKVGVLHGKMSDEDKAAVIDRMKTMEYRVLITTTVIEVGITLPSLRAVLIVEADKYGVSQLHQLRGRVARHGGRGYFFLYLPYEVEADTLERLMLLEEYVDGYTLSEHDADLRGYGDLSGESESQHGKSKSGIFMGVKLTPKDIREAASQ
jgi:ATP-dependent DNA helicase RecG